MHTTTDAQRAADVEQTLARLTLDEKVLLLEGVDSWNTNAIDRLGIPALLLTDGPHGLRKVREASSAFDLADAEHATSFPTSATVANSWDPELARRKGRAIGRECLDHGVDVLLAPGVNIKRNPLGGRNFEYYSEDPLLSGVFGSAFVQGVQGEGVGTSVKHFAANSNEDYRFVGDSLVDERALREIYLPAFERIVREARPATVMCAYNALNGTFCSDHRELLTGILRDEWGFDGVVMTDWGAMHDRVASIEAGCELDMPGGVLHNRRALVEAVRDGRLDESTLDEAVRRMLRLIAASPAATRRTHAAASGASAPTPRADLAAHAALARDIAIESAVLLQNDGVLPLDRGAGSLVVVGEMFEKMRFQGAGSSLVNPPEVVTPKQAFDARGIAYRYERGYRSLHHGRDHGLERAAVRAVGRGDTVLFFGGLGDFDESEGFDRRTMALADAQRHLLRDLVGTGARVVLVLFGGAPVELPFADDLAAVLDLYLPGMHGGEAAAALLFGEANPSGKLAETWTVTAADAGSAADYDRGRVSQYAESIYVGYRFHDLAGTGVRYPFGHGLSYTAFDYAGLAVREAGGRVTATATIANTGDREGAEVVQLYVRNHRGRVFKADKELRAFTKVRLAAGETAEIELSFDLADLAYWDVADHARVLENGDYEVLLAASAADVRLAAPLAVTTGRESRSPYPAEVDAAYATPPRGIPDAFPALLGRPVPPDGASAKLDLETRLVDARHSATGRIVYTAVLWTVRREYRKALALPDSLERDARVKNAHFVVRMMPSTSLRSMAMASGGVFPFHVAQGLAEIGTGHPFRGVRRVLGWAGVSTGSTGGGVSTGSTGGDVSTGGG